MLRWPDPPCALLGAAAAPELPPKPPAPSAGGVPRTHHKLRRLSIETRFRGGLSVRDLTIGFCL